MFDVDLDSISKLYNNSAQAYGDSPKAARWADTETQERRFEVLCAVGDLKTAKVLDFGCNVGHLLRFMRERLDFKGEYVGYDISPLAILEAAENFPFPEVRFKHTNILVDQIPEDFDYVLMSGLFSDPVSDNWALMECILKRLFVHTRKALTFNMFSTRVDYQSKELFYYQPEEVLAFCLDQLSHRVILRHDYRLRQSAGTYEFTVYVYKE